MWRCKVFAGSHRSLGHRYLQRCYTSGKVEPITTSEFLDALFNVVPEKNWNSVDEIGLACSGGVDSIALALLYSNARRITPYLPDCHGIIIDHASRPESSEDAEWTAATLRSKFQMDASVIKLEWPADLTSQEAQRRFETHARTLRYQALGRACWQRKLRHLLVAHHADDQAETVILRLASRRWRTGVQGMRSVENIPECYGIYGVRGSGHDLVGHRHGSAQTGGKLMPYPFESGGVQILRSLLGFGKDRLIATCEHEGVTWIEDSTNANVTLTPRNAIRHMRKYFELPEALSRTSLVALSKGMQARMSEHRLRARKLFNSIPLHLDVQTGALIVRLPLVEQLLAHPIVSPADRYLARDTASMLLEHFAALVAPREGLRAPRLANTVLQLYPSLAVEGDGESATPNKAAAMSIFGVWLRPLSSTSDFHIRSKKPEDAQWLLSRQPMQGDELERTRIVIPPYSIRTPATHSEHHSTGEPRWHLFDGRYWIRIMNQTDNDIVIRAITDAEILALVSSMPKGEEEPSTSSIRETDSPDRAIATAISLIKPGTLRRSLPGLFLRTPPSQDGMPATETIIALPTFPMVADKVASDRLPFWFETRYKDIDVGDRRIEDTVVKPITKSHINMARTGVWFRLGRKLPSRTPVQSKKRWKQHAKSKAHDVQWRRVNKKADTVAQGDLQRDLERHLKHDLERSLVEDLERDLNGHQGAKK